MASREGLPLAFEIFDANRYSVPFTHAAMVLTLQADEQFVSIYDYDKERLIAQHAHSHQKHRVVENLLRYVSAQAQQVLAKSAEID